MIRCMCLVQIVFMGSHLVCRDLHVGHLNVSEFYCLHSEELNLDEMNLTQRFCF